MKKTVRGAALPETAIVLTVVLILLFAAIQLAVIGFTQATADGAAFVAAHAQAVNSGVSGPTVAQTAFPTVAGHVTTSTPAPTTVQAQVSLTAGGLVLLPGAPASYPIYGGDVESTYGGASGPGTYTFSATATLSNVYSVTSGAYVPNYGIYLAQTLDLTGNGINGNFKPWTCHLDAYQAMAQNFPSAISSAGYVNPSTGLVGIQNTIFDPSYSSGSGSEYYIYHADSGSKNAGMNC